MVKPSRRKEMAQRAYAHYGTSIRLVCSVFGISESGYHYQARLATENAEIADWLLRLTTANKRWGFGLCYLYLRNVKGFAWTETKQHASGIVSHIDYRQSWPYTGMPEKSWQTVKGKKISETYTNPKLRSSWNHKGNNKVIFPYIKTSTENKWNLDGTLISTVTTSKDDLDDYGNFKTIQVTTEGGGKTFTRTAKSTYKNDPDPWYLGRLTQAKVTHQGNGDQKTRTSAFKYIKNTGLLSAETVEPNHKKQLTTSYSYDRVGNRTAVTVSGNGLSGRTTKTFYDNNKQFPTAVSNALGHSETRTYDPRFGVVTQMTGPNGLTTQWQYDDFGRKTKQQRADGNSTQWTRRWARDCQSPHPQAVWCLEVKKDGASLSNTQFDKLGRQLRSVSTGFDGRYALIDKQYDRQGREIKVSQPYFEGESKHWTESFYDDLGRVNKVTTMGPQGYKISVTTEFNGLQTHSKRRRALKRNVM